MAVEALPRDRWPEGSSLDDFQVHLLHEAVHEDAASVLGLRPLPGGLWVIRAWHGALEAEGGSVRLRFGQQPDATEVVMERRCGWLYEVVVSGAPPPTPYTLVRVEGSKEVVLYDASAFREVLLEDEDVQALQAGFLPSIGDVMGCHVHRSGGFLGFRFAVWAPRAKRVAVVGDWNGWDGRAHPLRRRLDKGTSGFTGLWELFIPFGEKLEQVPFGARYMMRIRGADGETHDKIDPFAQQFEVPPQHACIASACDDAALRSAGAPAFEWSAGDAEWLRQRKALDTEAIRRRPMAIYEVHLPSWRRADDGSILNYRALAGLLVDHLQAMHFNWLELLPLAQHPFAGSWGYQVTGHYATYSVLGTPDDFKFFVDAMHQAGIGVLMDFVPAHFCKDAWALIDYDGSATFEYEDPREGEHKEWGTKVFNFAKNEVRAYLLGAPMFWIERYHIDGLRVDAVSAMLYRNFMREEGDWLPNAEGGDSYLEAVSLLREMNRRIKEAFPGVVMCAEESTCWSGITGSLDTPSGLGFDFKWDLGWMNDTLSYLSSPSCERPSKHEKLTFRGLYMQHERWVLPLSHDEVVSGKGSLVDKMSYMDHPEFYDKVQLLKALYGFQVGSPGRPLLFMGAEIGQGREWNYAQSLDWHEGEEDLRSKLCTWLSDLLGVYQYHKPLHAGDDEPHGDELRGLSRSFEWTEVDNRDACVVAFVRHWREERPVLILCNFSPRRYDQYALGVPFGGAWQMLLNSDECRYGGTGCGPGNQVLVETLPDGRYGWPACLRFDVPANGCFVMLGPEPTAQLPQEGADASAAGPAQAAAA